MGKVAQWKCSLSDYSSKCNGVENYVWRIGNAQWLHDCMLPSERTQHLEKESTKRPTVLVNVLFHTSFICQT